jgi:hypothetical protein
MFAVRTLFSGDPAAGFTGAEHHIRFWQADGYLYTDLDGQFGTGSLELVE